MNLYETLVAARNALEADGWKKIDQRMTDTKDGTEYGLKYTNRGATFWLNIETMYNLPTN